MSSRFGEHLRGNVVGYVAVFIALCGSAAALPGTNKVDSGDIKRGNVKASDIGANAVSGDKVADGSLSGADLADNSLTGQQINESSLNLPATPTSLPPSGAAGGDLAGTYPDPTIVANAVGTAEVDGTLTAADIVADSLGAGAIDESTLFNDNSLAADDLAPNSVGGSEVDEGTLSTVPSASSANSLAGNNMLQTAATSLNSGGSQQIGFAPANLALSCPSGEANLSITNGSLFEIVSFLDKGGATPEYERIASGASSAVETDATDPDFWIWHVAAETDVSIGGPNVFATFLIGIDESDGTDCEYYVRLIART